MHSRNFLPFDPVKIELNAIEGDHDNVHANTNWVLVNFEDERTGRKVSFAERSRVEAIV